MTSSRTQPCCCHNERRPGGGLNPGPLGPEFTTLPLRQSASHKKKSNLLAVLPLCMQKILILILQLQFSSFLKRFDIGINKKYIRNKIIHVNHKNAKKG